MNKTIYIFSFLMLLISCSSETSKEVEFINSENLNIEMYQEKDTLENKDFSKDSIALEYWYDTISNEKYDIHLHILRKIHSEVKRERFFSNGDTIYHFIYAQDIAAFYLGLDSNENETYKQLTNKVVFMILENESSLLQHGLTSFSRDDKRLDYFMEHVSNPKFNTKPIDSIISLVKRDFNAPTERTQKVKEILIDKLKQGKIRV